MTLEAVRAPFTKKSVHGGYGYGKPDPDIEDGSWKIY